MSTRLARAAGILLHVEGTPHRTALGFALGVFIAFFPVIGIHTAMALLLAFAFRLSRVAVLTGAYVNNPWTIAPLYLGGTLLGCALLAVPADGLVHVEWSGASGPAALLHALQPYLWPYVVGNLVAGVAGAALAYWGLRSFLERRRSAA